MARQFPPRAEGQDRRGQSRQAFAGSRSGAVRNAAPVRPTRVASTVPRKAVAGPYPSMTGHVAVDGNDTLTLGAKPLVGTLRIWLAGVLLDAGDWSRDGRVVTLATPLTAGQVLVDQYWTRRQNPAHSVLTGGAWSLNQISSVGPNSDYYSIARVNGTRAMVVGTDASGTSYNFTLVSGAPAVLDTYSIAMSDFHAVPYEMTGFGADRVALLANDTTILVDGGIWPDQHQVVVSLHRFDFTGDTIPSPTTSTVEDYTAIEYDPGIGGGPIIYGPVPEWHLLPLSDNEALLLRIKKDEAPSPYVLESDSYSDTYDVYAVDIDTMTVSSLLTTFTREGTAADTAHPYGGWSWICLGDGTGVFAYDAAVNDSTSPHDYTHILASASSWTEVTSAYNLRLARQTPGQVMTAGSAYVFTDNASDPTAQLMSASGGALAFTSPTIVEFSAAFWGAPGTGTLVKLGSDIYSIANTRDIYVFSPTDEVVLVTATTFMGDRSAWVGLDDRIVGVDRDGIVYSVSPP